MQLLAIPVNETSRGFPFPLLPRVARLKESLLTCPPNHVDKVSVAQFDPAVRDGHHMSSLQAKSLIPKWFCNEFNLPCVHRIHPAPH